MTKGNLNDLIRQEANKTVEPESPNSLHQRFAPTPTTKRTRETNATLQAKITELTNELQAGEEKTKTLEERIKTLEKEREREKTRGDRLRSGDSATLEANIKTLQERIKTLEKELKQAKERGDRFQSESNARLEEVKTLQERIKPLEKALKREQELQELLTEKTALVETLSTRVQQSEQELETGKQLVEKLYSRIQTLESPPKPEPVPKPAAKNPRLYNFETRTLARYVAPKPSSTELTDTEIGWFD